MPNVIFKVSDMLRARCVFLEVVDIIETVNDIKRFIKDDKRFGMV